MKINHFDFSDAVELEGGAGVLVCENPSKFTQYCRDFVSMQNGDDGNFIITDGAKTVQFKKEGRIIFDFFELSLCDKKIVSGLYSELSETTDANFQSEFLDLKGRLLSFLDALSVESSLAVDYSDEFTLSDLLKTVKLQPQSKDDLFLGNIIDYLDASAKYLGTKLFVLVGLRTYLSDEDYEMLLQHIGYSSYNVLFLERTQYNRVKNEPVKIIDEDLCEIIVSAEKVC